METYTHKCIKCGETYTDNDVDPYLCTKCIEIKNQIAKEVDSKIVVSREPVKSDLQMFDELARSKGVRFPNIKDLGIKL